MRYPANHKQQIRDHIIEMAARQFRAMGGEGVGVVEVMNAAGMTQGGFYKHFSSKDQLFAASICAALKQVSAQLRSIAGDLPRGEALRKVIGTYLSPEHVNHPDVGCALAALGNEIARMPEPMKKIVAEALDSYAAELSFLMPGKTVAQQKAAFNVLFSSMAGCIVAARAQTSKKRQLQILSTGRVFFEQAFCSDQLLEFLEKVQ